jgi:serine phosphatase RsbU (regulator of sigma subunit)/tetratricopeptide (TPR) repeat protein
MKILKYILLLIIILSLDKDFQCVAQNYADKEYYLVDSLDLDALKEDDKKLIETSLKEYHSAKDDTTKIKALNGICENMIDEDWKKYQFCQFNQLQILLKNNFSVKETKALQINLASALNNIGLIYEDEGDILKALDYFNKSLKINKEIGDKKGIANSSSNIGSIYNRQGDIPKALEYLHKSLKISEEIGDKELIASSLNDIGGIYNSQGELPKALEYIHRSLKLREGIGDKEGIASSLNNIGDIYRRGQEELPKALEYFHKSLTIYEEIGAKSGIAAVLNNIGLLHKGKGELQKALEYFHKSLAIQKKIGNKSGITAALSNIGFLEMGQGELALAEKHLQRSLKLAREVGSPKWMSSSSSSLSKLAKMQGKYELAMQMFELHIQMRDSINNEATQKASAQQEAKYAYEKQKTIDDAGHDKLLAIEQEAKAKQKVITIAIGAGLGLVIIFLIFVFNRLQVTKKQKLVIEEQRDVVEEAHKEIRDSINYAERIQRSFLATDELLNNNLKDYFVFFQPKDVVSGDFYWAGKLANNNFAVVNADSTGHGVPGAIMSILNISSIEKAIDNKLVKPADIFNHTRNTIIERLSKDGSKEGGKDGMDASIISFDFEHNKFSYTAAQNPIWIIRHGELIEIKPEKMPIGKHDNDTVPFVGGEFETQKGDIIYTITDGFHDQFGGEKGKKFMVKPFKAYLISIAHLPMQEQKEKLTETFTTWKGDEEQVDDVCIIGVKV